MEKNLDNLKLADAIIKSVYVTVPTRAALQQRLINAGTNRFFSDAEFQLLSIICDLLVDQDTQHRIVNIALSIDERLANNESDGWRYDCMPPDPIMYNLGLQAIDKIAIKKFGENFVQLETEYKIQILNLIQKGEVHDTAWKGLDPKLFFEEVLAETTEIFFSHPAVQTSINYVGMADAKGWTKIKLGQTENLENVKT